MSKHLLAALAVTIMLFSASSALAIDKIYDPYVEKGELELEYSGFRTADSDTSKNNAQGHEIELGYGITDHWEAEITGAFARDAGGPTVMEALELENKFQFFERGEMWVDAGLLLAYSHAMHSDDADAIEAKLLLQKSVGKFTSLANIGLEQGIGSDSHGGPDVSLSWNNRYRLTKYFQPGIELQSDFGQTNTHTRFNEEEHFIGPAAFGRLFGGDENGAVKYEVAYLFGVTSASPASAGRVLLEYEVHF